MKATPLQPSLINPTYMMTQGIGNNKKSLCLTSEQLPGLVMQQNNLTVSKERYYDDEDEELEDGGAFRP